MEDDISGLDHGGVSDDSVVDVHLVHCLFAFFKRALGMKPQIKLLKLAKWLVCSGDDS